MRARMEIGLVARDASLVDFYVGALRFERASTFEFPQGTVHRFVRDDAGLKLFYPTDPAEAIDADPWHAVAGFRYATLLVDDVDTEADRVASHGGVVDMGPVEHRPGARMALVRDPEGNVLELLSEAG